jgi:hypothetical protein
MILESVFDPDFLRVHPIDDGYSNQ